MKNLSRWRGKKTNPIQTQFQRQKMLLHLKINGRFSTRFPDSYKKNVFLELFHLMSLFKLDSLQRDEGGEKRVFIPYKAFPHRKDRAFHSQNIG